jgi:DNA-binding beta-propeller fold protein YncE
MTIEPRGIIAVDKVGDRILFLDPRSLAIISEIRDMPCLPHELTLSPDRSRAFVPAFGDGAHGDNPHPNHLLSVIDLDRRVRLSDIDLSPLHAPHTLRFAPDGLLYVACEDSGKIAVVDVDKGRVVDRVETGSTNSHRLVVLGARGLICTDNEEDGSISLIDIKQRCLLGKIALPDPIAGIAASPDEATLYCTSGREPRVWPVSVADGAVGVPIDLRDHEKSAQVIRVTRDGKRLVVVGDQEPVVTVIDITTPEQRSVRVGAKPMDGAFHFDGKTFLLANEESATLSEIDLNSGRVTRTASVGTGCETLAYF